MNQRNQFVALAGALHNSLSDHLTRSVLFELRMFVEQGRAASDGSVTDEELNWMSSILCSLTEAEAHYLDARTILERGAKGHAEEIEKVVALIRSLTSTEEMGEDNRFPEELLEALKK